MGRKREPKEKLGRGEILPVSPFQRNRNPSLIGKKRRDMKAFDESCCEEWNWEEMQSQKVFAPAGKKMVVVLHARPDLQHRKSG